MKWALYSSTIEASIITKNIPRVPHFTYTLKEPKTLFYFLRPLPSSTLIDYLLITLIEPFKEPYSNDEGPCVIRVIWVGASGA